MKFCWDGFERCFQLLLNVQEQLVIKAASAYNCTIKPAFSICVASPLLAICILPCILHFTSALAWGNLCKLTWFLLFFFLLFFWQRRPERHKSTFFVLPQRTGSPFIYKVAHALCIPSPAGCCHSALLKPISVLVPSALPQFGSWWFYKAILALFMLMLHSSMPA